MTSHDEATASPPETGITTAGQGHETDLAEGTPGTKCRDMYCYAPDTACHLGNTKLSDCENWRSEGESLRAESSDDYRPPWSGLALGSVDLSAVAATRRARIVAIVGAADAGKTSALAAYFIQLRRGHCVDGLRFAGSFTLLGWDQIAHHAEFPPGGSRSFPPHTTSGRSPALLHVRLASSPKQMFDVYFTDVPGEWFEEWAFEAASAPGAQWIAERADLFVLLSDTGALKGPERGQARSSYQVLARRVASAAGGRKVIPIRTKSDLGEIPERINSAVARLDLELFGTVASPMSVIADSPVPDQMSPLEDVIRCATARRPLPSLEAADPLDEFRRRLVPT